PMYWYSTPALLKQWEDDVLLYGWAYGSTGNALAGKELLVAVSTGGAGDAYSRESSYGYTLTELLRPLQATANMVQMTYLEPFTTTGILTITDEALAQRVEDYAATLASKDLPVLEPHG
uniref:NAD(P)H-dependent oxidoreductase n=1 Tax=Actinomyces oris TaxID=544580 RepID=UPI0028D21044